MPNLMQFAANHAILALGIAALAVLILLTVWNSIRVVGPAEVGLVMKRFGRKLPSDNPIAFHGKAGYQAELLMPGFRFKWWFLYKVEKFPWVQVPANEIGVLIAQVGKTLPAGAKSARYKKEIGNFTDLPGFISNEGEKGVQRPVLAPGSLLPIHPVAFLIITKNKVFGLPISPDFQAREGGNQRLTPASFNLEGRQLDVFRVEPQLQQGSEEKLDVVGVVTTLEGDPLDSGHIASRLAGSVTWKSWNWRARTTRSHRSARAQDRESISTDARADLEPAEFRAAKFRRENDAGFRHASAAQCANAGAPAA